MTQLFALVVTCAVLHTALLEVLRALLPVEWRPARLRLHRAVFGAAAFPAFVWFTSSMAPALAMALVYLVASVSKELPEVLRFRTLALALRELDQPSSVSSGLARLQVAIEKHPGRSKAGLDYGHFAAFVHQVATEVAARGHLEPAFRWMTMVEPSMLDPRALASRVQSLASWHIGNQDVARAREELSRLTPPHPDPEWERALRAVGLLVRSIEGEDTSDALDELSAKETRPSVLLFVAQARAHALATRGLTDDLRAQLEALRKEDSRQLVAIARHGGPASAVAALLAEDKPVPYR
jgi:hypothetical protein